jgi:chromosome segregation ATPase
MNAKLSNIELKNDSLENRMTAIENEMRSLNEVRGSLDTLRSHVSKLDEGVTGVKSDLSNFEANVSAIGKVFDTVKETAEANRTVINNNIKSLDQYIQSQKLTGRKVTEELKRMRELDANLQSFVTDIKVC